MSSLTSASGLTVEAHRDEESPYDFWNLFCEGEHVGEVWFNSTAERYVCDHRYFEGLVGAMQHVLARIEGTQS